jgi:hypothetical protein
MQECVTVTQCAMTIGTSKINFILYIIVEVYDSNPMLHQVQNW